MAKWPVSYSTVRIPSDTKLLIDGDRTILEFGVMSRNTTEN